MLHLFFGKALDGKSAYRLLVSRLLWGMFWIAVGVALFWFDQHVPNFAIFRDSGVHTYMNLPYLQWQPLNLYAAFAVAMAVGNLLELVEFRKLPAWAASHSNPAEAGSYSSSTWHSVIGWVFKLAVMLLIFVVVFLISN